MNKQITLSALTDELGQAATHKKESFQQIDRIIPWSKWRRTCSISAKLVIKDSENKRPI